jgi:hypothetical protein
MGDIDENGMSDSNSPLYSPFSGWIEITEADLSFKTSANHASSGL